MIMLSTGAKYGFRNALPFVFGVIVGKQIIIWPIGFGLLLLNKEHPYVFLFFKYVSAAYILWLAWRIANMRISAETSDRPPPGFLSGLIVHPLNPKAWAARLVGGSVYERYLMLFFALLTIIFVGLALLSY